MGRYSYSGVVEISILSSNVVRGLTACLSESLS